MPVAPSPPLVRRTVKRLPRVQVASRGGQRHIKGVQDVTEDTSRVRTSQEESTTCRADVAT
eukprot:433011-Alexandrium_andersonii.AAC.2